MQISYFGDLGFLLKGNNTPVAIALPAEKTGDAEIVITATADEKIKAGGNQTVFDWPGETYGDIVGAHG